MQNNWIEFLSKQGATTDPAGNLVFGNTRKEIVDLQTNPTIISLHHLGVARVQGEDAQTFLQGQLTNDISLLGEAKIQLSGYCNPKGRMLAQFIIIPETEGFILLTPRSIFAKTINRLKMFVLRSKVEITDIGDDYTCIGFAGNGVETVLSNMIPGLPEQDFTLQAEPNHIIAKIPGTLPRYLVVTKITNAISLWESQADKFSKAGPSAWHWLDIHAGLPVILPETIEEFVPQMVNLELIGGVSFKKGCYTGQEIVARMHYLGKAKRRMFRLHQNEDTLPPPGADIFDAAGDTQSVGKVVIAEPAADGVDMLAVIQLSHVQSDALHQGSPSGPQLKVESLPYSIDEKA